LLHFIFAFFTHKKDAAIQVTGARVKEEDRCGGSFSCSTNGAG
jgi:hypothetical protein